MSAGPSLTVCRDCCCGTARKHPGVDHRAQLERFRAAGRVRVSDCLDACAYSNVVVVSPSPAGRAAGAGPVWIFGVLDAETEDEVVAWVESGGPGVAEPPGLLDLRIFRPARKVRAAVD